MKNTIITYETQHGSAKKIAETLGRKLDAKVINVDTPFEAEDLSSLDNIIMVFNFRGPYTAQLTKLYLNRVQEQLKSKRLILVGEGIFSEKEFPVVADEISKIAQAGAFSKYFIQGQLRPATLYPEEKALLKKFSELTGMEIVDMGELDLKKAEAIADEIIGELASPIDAQPDSKTPPAAEELERVGDKWVCKLCGYEYIGENPPEKCPLCGAPASAFVKKAA